MDKTFRWAVDSSLAECKDRNGELQLSKQTIHHPFEITRCQRRELGKCLPRSTQLSQRGLKQMKHNVSSRGCKGLSGRLVTVSRSTAPHSLSPHSFAVCRSTLSPYHRVAGHQQRRSCVQAGRLRLVCHRDPFCQSSGSARSSRSHLMTWACWSGESTGKALDTVLTSPTLWGPLYSLIPDY